MAKKKKTKAGKFKISKKDVDAAKKKAEISIRNAKEKLLRAEKDVRKYIKKNPKKAAVIAAGIGVAVGAIVGKALKKTKHR